LRKAIPPVKVRNGVITPIKLKGGLKSRSCLLLITAVDRGAIVLHEHPGQQVDSIPDPVQQHREVEVDLEFVRHYEVGDLHRAHGNVGEVLEGANDAASVVYPAVVRKEYEYVCHYVMEELVHEVVLPVLKKKQAEEFIGGVSKADQV